MHNWPKIIELLTQTYGKVDDGGGELEYETYSSSLGTIRAFYRPTKKQQFYIQGKIHDVDRYTALRKERFDKMALSIFTDAERKDLEGFLGVKWGDTVDKVGNDMLLVGAYEEKKTYIKNEKPYFGSLPVDAIEYEFINDKLTKISIHTEDMSASLLRSILELNFGKFEYLTADTYTRELPKTYVSISDYGRLGTYIRAQSDASFRARIEEIKNGKE